jgi:hypothetical protein
MSIVNVSGMYSLVLSSRKPEARAFRKCVNTQTALSAAITLAPQEPILTIRVKL